MNVSICKKVAMVNVSISKTTLDNVSISEKASIVSASISKKASVSL